MTTTAWRRGLAAAALVPLLAGLTACSSDDKKDKDAGEKPTVGAGACGALPTADPQATLPEGITSVDGTILYEPSKQGSTVIVFGLVPDDNFASVRDELVNKLLDKGWKIDGTDQESVEAEAQFSKAAPLRTGTIKVQPLCKGYSTVRFKLNQ